MHDAELGAPYKGAEPPFLPMLRRTQAELEAEIAKVSRHKLTDTLLQVFHGVVMVLNAERQILAINTNVLKRLGIPDPHSAFGRRPGEVFACAFSQQGLDGCGTGPACASCGAALAMLACRQLDEVSERECYLSANINGEARDFEFMARCTPLHVEDSVYVVLSLQDINKEKQLEKLQGLFLHDLLNALTSLVFYAEELSDCPHPDTAQSANEIYQVVNSIREMTLSQRDLQSMEAGTFVLYPVSVRVDDVIAELDLLFANTKKRDKQRLLLPIVTTQETLLTDKRLLVRVLMNMIKNALEATPQGGQVTVDYHTDNDSVTFSVWNPGAIAATVAPRIFQRSFSTKPGKGRGLGAFSMKLIGESYLGGSVTFDTGVDGTTFRFELPRGSLHA